MLIAVLCLFLPSLACALLLIGWGIAEWCRRLRRVEDRCSHNHPHVDVTVDGVEFWLCQNCDSGDVVDGQWQFAEPVPADHTL